MDERATFFPKKNVLSFGELGDLCDLFVDLGVRRLRFTGGEPLVRRGFLEFLSSRCQLLERGKLDEITLTTNGTQLAACADQIYASGVRRVNVSLDSLDRQTFARIARRDRLGEVLAGIDAAQRAGLKVKINTVVLQNDNRAEIPSIIQWAHSRGLDITLIETMPIGEIEQDRTDQFVSLAALRHELESYWSLVDLPDRTGGPARYVRVAETGGRLGFITPLSHSFCESCSRVRLTCTGRLYLCLGQEESVDLQAHMRAGQSRLALANAISAAMGRRPKGHDFSIDRPSSAATMRPMSMTGG